MHHLDLIGLYNVASKHSNYQILARPLQAIIQQDNLNITSRYEIERLDYILARSSVLGRSVVDIGGNTGFFTLECAAHGAASVSYYEGNEAHAEFVKAAVKVLHFEKVVKVFTQYFNFKDDFNGQVDVCFNLNVLHHIGDDYGDSSISRDEAKKEILRSLSYLSRKSKVLIFQLGFNWKGDRSLALFEHGTKAELIEFITKGTFHDWEVLNIGIAQKNGSGIAYQELNETNMLRDDSLGEFLNRPLFIMRSKLLK